MSTTNVKNIPNQRWLRIIPAVILVYIFSFMDRANIGFAMAGGMNESLAMSASIAGMAAGIFFIGYMVLQVPGGHFAEHGNAKKFIGWSILFWGGLSILCGVVQNATQLLILRFLLGVAEGGVYPAILVLISHWFPNEERARANAYFQMNVAIASIITGPLSGWIISTYGWREVFFIEGAISLLLIFVWFPLTENRPEEAKWLSKEEKDYILGRLREEQEGFNSNGKGSASYRQIFSDINLWKLILIYFFFQTGAYGFSLWLPSILKSLTNTGMTSVGILTVFPYVGTAVGLYIFGNLSDRTMNRRLYTALPMIGFAACFLLSVQFKNQIWVSYAFLIGCGIFQQAPVSTFWTMPPLLFPAEVAGGVRGIINSLGNLGGFCGPLLVGFLRTGFDSYDVGVYSLVISLMAGFLITLSLPAKTAGQAQNAGSSAKSIG